MADDREVLRVVWDGRLPVCFNLSSDEVVTVEQPDPYYVRSCILDVSTGENFSIDALSEN